MTESEQLEEILEKLTRIQRKLTRLGKKIDKLPCLKGECNATKS